MYDLEGVSFHQGICHAKITFSVLINFSFLLKVKQISIRRYVGFSIWLITIIKMVDHYLQRVTSRGASCL